MPTKKVILWSLRINLACIVAQLAIMAKALYDCTDKAMTLTFTFFLLGLIWQIRARLLIQKDLVSTQCEIVLPGVLSKEFSAELDKLIEKIKKGEPL